MKNSLGGNCILSQTSRGDKADREFLEPGITIWGFWGKRALAHFRRNFVEVDLRDMRRAGGIFEVLGRDGHSQLQSPKSKSPLNYLADSRN